MVLNFRQLGLKDYWNGLRDTSFVLKSTSIMNKLVIRIILFVCSQLAVAQTTISGLVTDKAGQPIMGANIYLEGTYDGASSDLDGRFSFETTESGVQFLQVSFVSYESFSMSADVTQMNDLEVKLTEDVNSLETVVISAGSFSAGDNSKISVLKPLDVVTTASALGDFVGALQDVVVAADGELPARERAPPEASTPAPRPQLSDGVYQPAVRPMPR